MVHGEHSFIDDVDTSYYSGTYLKIEGTFCWTGQDETYEIFQILSNQNNNFRVYSMISLTIFANIKIIQQTQ